MFHIENLPYKQRREYVLARARGTSRLLSRNDEYCPWEPEYRWRNKDVTEREFIDIYIREIGIG